MDGSAAERATAPGRFSEFASPPPADPLRLAAAERARSWPGRRAADRFGSALTQTLDDLSLPLGLLVDKRGFLGSTSAVVEKLGQRQHRTRGFSRRFVMVCEFSTEQGAWEESLNRLVEDVLPQLF